MSLRPSNVTADLFEPLGQYEGLEGREYKYGAESRGQTCAHTGYPGRDCKVSKQSRSDSNSTGQYSRCEEEEDEEEEGEGEKERAFNLRS